MPDLTDANFGRRVIRAFAWQGGAGVAGQSISWVITFIVIRLLTEDDYGLMAYANVYIGLILLVADLGFGAAAIQARELERDQLRSMYGMAFLFNLGMVVISFAAAPAVAAYYQEPEVVPIIRVLSLNFLLAVFYVVPEALVIRKLDFRTKALIEAGVTVIGALTALVFAFKGFGVWSLVASALARNIVKVAAYNIPRSTRTLLWPSFNFRGAMALAQFGTVISLSRILFFVYGQLDIAIGGRTLDKGVIGVYAVALSIVTIPLGRILPAVTQVSFAAFSRIQTDTERMKRNLVRTTRLLSMLIFPTFLGMAVVTPDLIPLLLGDKWLHVIVPIQLLSLSVPLKALSTLFSPALFARGRPGVNVGNMVISIILIGSAMVVGARHGVIGLCLAWVAMYPVVFVITGTRTLKVLGIPVATIGREILFPLLLGALMAGSVWLFITAASGWSAVVRLPVAILIGVGLYGGLNYVLRKEQILELYRLVAKKS